MTEAEWIALAADIGDAYGRPIGERWIELWYGSVAQFDLEVVKEAVRLHAAGERGAFMPHGGDLEKLCRDLVDPRPDFDEVWAAIIDAIRLHGWEVLSRAGYADDPESRLVRALGGWREIGLLPTDQMGTMRAQARRIYEDQADRVEREAPRARIEGRKRGELTSARQLLGDGGVE